MSTLTLTELLNKYLNQYNLQPSRENNQFVINIIKERRRYLNKRIRELRSQINDSLQILNEIRTDNALLIQQHLWMEEDNVINRVNVNTMNIQNINHNDLTTVCIFRRYG